MAELRRQQTGEVFKLDGSECSIGRRSGNDIPLADSSISRHHASLTRTDQGWVIEDLGSSRGSFVNDLLVTEPTPLRDGDSIRFGVITFSFAEEAMQEAPASSGSGPPMTDEKQAREEPSSQGSAPSPGSQSQGEALHRDILSAAKSGNVAKMRELMAGPSQPVSELLRVMNEDGCTPLHLAAEEGHNDMVKLLLSLGAEVGMRGERYGNQPPLALAALRSRLSVALTLLNNGADPNSASSGNWTALHMAARRSDSVLARSLIAFGADVNARATGILEGATPLHMAAESGNLETCELLVDKGANANAVSHASDLGYTPLHYAASGGHADVVEFLLANGARSDEKSSRGLTHDGSTPLDLARMGGHDEVVRLLRRSDADAGVGRVQRPEYGIAGQDEQKRREPLTSPDPAELSARDRAEQERSRLRNLIAALRTKRSMAKREARVYEKGAAGIERAARPTAGESVMKVLVFIATGPVGLFLYLCSGHGQGRTLTSGEQEDLVDSMSGARTARGVAGNLARETTALRHRLMILRLFLMPGGLMPRMLNRIGPLGLTSVALVSLSAVALIVSFFATALGLLGALAGLIVTLILWRKVLHPLWLVMKEFPVYPPHSDALPQKPAYPFVCATGLLLAFLLLLPIGVRAHRALTEEWGTGQPAKAAAVPAETVVDPVHGFFRVTLPPECKLAKRDSATTATVTEGELGASRAVRCSRLSFSIGQGTIAVSARETFHEMTADELMYDVVQAIILQTPSASVKDKQVRTVDGVTAVEVLVDVQRSTGHKVRFKKDGLDHTISFTCPAPSYDALRGEFLAFVGGYQSRAPSDGSAEGTPPEEGEAVETPSVAPESPEPPDTVEELELPMSHVVLHLPTGFLPRESPRLDVAGGVRSVCFSPDSRFVAAVGSGRGRGPVRVWNAASGEERYTIAAKAWSGEFSPDSRFLAMACIDRIDVRAAATGEEAWSIDVPDRELSCVKFSPDGKLIAAVAGAEATLWDVATRTKLRALPAAAAEIASVDISPDGALIALASGKDIRIFGVADGKEQRRLENEHADRVMWVAFAPRGRTVVSLSYTTWHATEIRLWNLATGRPLWSSARSREAMSSVAFSADGRLLAAGSARSRVATITIFDATTGKSLQRLTKAGYTAAAIDFSPDGDWLVSGDEDGVRRWALDRTVVVPVRSRIVALEDDEGLGQVRPNPRAPCFSRLLWNVAGKEDSPSTKELEGLVQRNAFSAVLLAQEMLREHTLGLDAPGRCLDVAHALAKAIEDSCSYRSLSDVVDGARRRSVSELAERRGLTFLAALHILMGEDRAKVAAAVRAAPDYACLFVVECVERQWTRPERLLPRGVPLPLEALENPHVDLTTMARRVAEIFKEQCDYSWLMAAAEMGGKSPTTHDRNSLRLGAAALARATAYASAFRSEDMKDLQRSVTSAFQRGLYTAIHARAQTEPQVADLLGDTDPITLAKADIATGSKLLREDRSDLSARLTVFEKEARSAPKEPADDGGEIKGTPAVGPPGRVPPGYKIYRLKDGRTITGKQVGSSRGRIMVKDLDGKSIVIDENQLTNGN